MAPASAASPPGGRPHHPAGERVCVCRLGAAGGSTADRTRPRAQLRSLTVGTLRGGGKHRSATITFRLSLSDDRTATKTLKVRCRLDAGKAKACKNGKVTLRVTSSGTHRLTVTVTDQAGNTTTLRRTFKVRVARRR